MFCGIVENAFTITRGTLGNTCFHITCQEGFKHIMEFLWFHPDVPKEDMVLTVVIRKRSLILRSLIFRVDPVLMNLSIRTHAAMDIIPGSPTRQLLSLFFAKPCVVACATKRVLQELSQINLFSAKKTRSPARTRTGTTV